MATRWSTTLDDAAPPSARRPRRLRTVSALLVLLMAAGGAQAGLASPSEPDLPEVGEVVEEAEEDVVPAAHEAAIAGYWQERDAAFARGAEAGVTFVASRLHPNLDHTVEACLRAWFPDGVQDDLQQEVSLRDDTIAPAPSWQMPYGALHDTELTDPVYRMHVQATLTGLPSNVDVDRVFGVHLAVVDGQAYGFAACMEPTVARTIIDDLATEPAAAAILDGSPTPPDTSGSVPQAPTGEAAPAPPADPALPAPPAPPRPEVPAPPPPHPAPEAPADHAPPPPAPPVVPPVPVSPSPIAWPTLPPREWPDSPPTVGEELTVAQELFIVLVLIDGLLQADALSVAEAIELLTELAEAPELDDDQRALVEANLELLRGVVDDPEADPPRLHVSIDPETGEPLEAGDVEEPLVPADGDDPVAEDGDGPVAEDGEEDATRAACEVVLGVLDVLDTYRTDCE